MRLLLDQDESMCPRALQVRNSQRLAGDAMDMPGKKDIHSLHVKHRPSSPTLSTNLLCIPNKGKMPPKLDRMKLFAASALAAKVGYASTRNVKTPEKTRIVLNVTRGPISTSIPNK
jgi:hypothetical protein